MEGRTRVRQGPKRQDRRLGQGLGSEHTLSQGLGVESIQEQAGGMALGFARLRAAPADRRRHPGAEALGGAQRHSQDMVWGPMARNEGM